MSAQYARIRGRRGHAKALVAVEHSMLVAIYHMLARDQPYRDLGADYFDRRNDPERQARRLVRKLSGLGYTVTAGPAP